MAKTDAELALDLASEYQQSLSDRTFFGGAATSREPAAVAAEWAEAMRELLA